jgi:GTPase SAR1 family protein
MVASKKGSRKSTKKGSKKSSKVKIPTEKGWMEKYEYVHIKEQSAAKRHMELKKILKDVPAPSVYRRLIAISTKLKTNNPENSKLLKQDAEWVKKQPVYKK